MTETNTSCKIPNVWVFIWKKKQSCFCGIENQTSISFCRNAHVSAGSKTSILAPFNWPLDLFEDQERADLFGRKDKANV